MKPNTEEANAIAGLTDEERAILAEDEAAAAPDPAPEDDEPLELRRDPLPVLNAHAPANAAELLAHLGNAEHSIKQQFEDGDITAREYADELEKISDKREEIRWAQRKADLAREMKETAETASWNREVESFLKTKAKDIYDKGEPALVAFDEFVKKVTADAANSRLSDRAQLELAHRMFLKDFGPAFGGKGQTPGKAQEDALASVKADESPARDDGRFADLDRLAASDPAAFEAAVAKLSRSEQDSYGF